MEQTEQEEVMTGSLDNHKVVSKNEWLKARKMLLNKKKEFTVLRDQLSQELRNLPWTAVDKEDLTEVLDTCNSRAISPWIILWLSFQRPSIYANLIGQILCSNIRFFLRKYYGGQIFSFV